MKRTQIRPVSRKRAAQNREYAQLRAEFLASRPMCEFPDGCVRPATEVHHRKGRVGALLLDTEHWSALCHACHSWVTGHPVAAFAMGISERRVGGAA